MRVSVVICTLNRAHSLGATLESLRYQRYQDIEVVVVNGPSTDDTEAVLDPWRDRIKVDHCPVPNLSVSRNIGIRAASGDLVAFIDDDALPEFDWLVQALPAFDDDEVAGVGGIVFDHTGMDLQYRYSAANRFAEVAHRSDRPFDDQCVPGTFQFPYLQGTNAIFRRSALLAVGGFDETYEYYLDETDLCCRLVDAGFVLRQLPDAPVHHKFLPSGIRDHQRIVTNWFPIMKNQVYFSYRHALGPFSEFDIHEHSRAFLGTRLADARHHEEGGRLAPGTSNTAAIVCAEATSVGIQLGRDRLHVRLGPVSWPTGEFKRFPTVDSSRRRKITFVSSGYVPNMTGGIARFISDLAPALARRGHEVRVITRALGPATVDLEDGVWVHRVEAPDPGDGGVLPDALPHVNAFATAALRELRRITTWSTHDVVYGPLWDVEILSTLRHTGLPTTVQVATPLAIAADMAGHLADPDTARALGRLMELEGEALAGADLFHANSSAVATTIMNEYPGRLQADRWSVVHLGVVDHAETKASRALPRHKGLIVFFVGRFEVRKGIDTLLQVIEQVAPERPDVTFVLAGEDRPLAPGEEPIGRSWAERHRAEPWAKRVQFVGEVTDDELHSWYRRCDIAVLPSRYESFGLVMVEAMMHERAVLACDTSGVREVVRNGVDGVLVPPGDAQALEAELRGLLDDTARRRELAAAGRRRFEEAFHIDRFAERFELFLGRVDHVRAGALDRGAGATLRHSDDVGELVDLRQGQRVVVPAQGADAVVRVCVRAVEDSLVAVSCSDRRTERVVPGVVRRLDARGDEPVELTVVAGAIEVLGAVVVRPES